MDIIISNSGGVPIYDQITRQMKGLILRGELAEGGGGPSLYAAAGQGTAYFCHYHQTSL